MFFIFVDHPFVQGNVLPFCPKCGTELVEGVKLVDGVKTEKMVGQRE